MDSAVNKRINYLLFGHMVQSKVVKQCFGFGRGRYQLAYIVTVLLWLVHTRRTPSINPPWYKIFMKSCLCVRSEINEWESWGEQRAQQVTKFILTSTADSQSKSLNQVILSNMDTSPLSGSVRWSMKLGSFIESHHVQQSFHLLPLSSILLQKGTLV